MKKPTMYDKMAEEIKALKAEIRLKDRAIRDLEDIASNANAFRRHIQEFLGMHDAS